MAIDTTLSRIGVGDFFAVVVPGFYILCVASLFGFASIPRSAQQDNPWELISFAVANVNVNWIAVIIIASYLVGSMARVLPVAWPDAWCRLILGGLLNLREDLYGKGVRFPYPEVLEGRLKSLGWSDTFKLSEPSSDEAKLNVTFNYWKIVICQESPELFAYVRRSEARVRMFAGVIWATGLSVILNAIQFSIPALRVWREPLILSASVSISIFLLFLLLLRSVRNEEARGVFFGYLAIRAKEEANESSPRVWPCQKGEEEGRP